MSKEDKITFKLALLLYSSLALLFFIGWYDIDLFEYVAGGLLELGIVLVVLAWLHNLR